MLIIQLPPWDCRTPSLGIAYLAAFLKSKGIDTKIYDLNIEMYNSENDARKTGWGSDDTFLWQVNRLEKRYLSMVESFAEKILSFREPIIGFSSIYQSAQFLNHLLKHIKTKAPNSIIIVGGPGTFFSQTREEFDKSLIDYFVVGEGEIALYELLTALNNNIKINFSDRSSIKIWKDNPLEKVTCISTPRIIDLDSLPLPTFEEFDLSLYAEGSDSKYFVLPIIFSKGCTRQCTFCGDKVLSNPYRCRKSKNVIKEIIMHTKRYKNIDTFSLIDLSLNANLKFLDEFCDRIIAEGLNVKWYGPAQVRPDMTYELLHKMKKAGCQLFSLGVESFSDRVLSMMKKEYTSDEATKFIRMTKEAGIKNNPLLIVGYPGETEEDFKATLEGIKRNATYFGEININICGMPIGSALWRYPEKHGCYLLPSGDWITHDYKNTYEVRKRRYNETIMVCKELNISIRQCLDLDVFEEYNKELIGRAAKTHTEEISQVKIFEAGICDEDRRYLRNVQQKVESTDTPVGKPAIENIKFPTYCCIALLESCFLRCRMCHKWKGDVNLRDPQ